MARTEVGGLLVELDRDPTLDLQAPLARALRDPSLELAYWLPEQSTWTDQDGHPVGSAEPGPATLHPTDLPQPRTGCRPALRPGPGGRGGVAERRSQPPPASPWRTAVCEPSSEPRLQELQSSRVRTLEAGRRERQRLERNLHDGAQQRLVGISIELGSLVNRTTADPQLQQRLARTRDEVSASLDQLRDIARGIYPAVLSGHGLAVALESLTAGAAVPVRLHVGLSERLSGSRSRSPRTTSSARPWPTSGSMRTPTPRASASTGRPTA